MVIGTGIVALLVFLAVARWLGRGDTGAMRQAAALFIPIWLIASSINMWIGVSRAGYTVMQELPILVPVFGIPAAIAGLVIWYLRRR